MAFQGIFMMRTAVIIPSRGFASLASKQTLVFKNGLPPAPSQIRHISIKKNTNNKMCNITIQLYQSRKKYEIVMGKLATRIQEC